MPTSGWSTGCSPRPHYGEAWGRHWLDLVRYAETNGYERDSAKPHAWRYRDYVIRAFNRDKPYDRFLHEQLAGDEIDPSSAESLIATGFLPAGPLGRRARRSRSGPFRRPGRHRLDGRPGVPGPVDQLRALPRPQERSAAPGRLLSVPGLLQRRHQSGRTQHTAGRPRTRHRGHVRARAAARPRLTSCCAAIPDCPARRSSQACRRCWARRTRPSPQGLASGGLWPTG